MKVTIKMDESGFSIDADSKLSQLEMLGFLDVAKDAILLSLREPGLVTEDEKTEEAASETAE